MRVHPVLLASPEADERLSRFGPTVPSAAELLALLGRLPLLDDVRLELGPLGAHVAGARHSPAQPTPQAAMADWSRVRAHFEAIRQHDPARIRVVCTPLEE